MSLEKHPRSATMQWGCFTDEAPILLGPCPSEKVTVHLPKRLFDGIDRISRIPKIGVYAAILNSHPVDPVILSKTAPSVNG